MQVPTDVRVIFKKKNYYMVTDADRNMQCFADCFITKKKTRTALPIPVKVTN